MTLGGWGPQGPFCRGGCHRHGLCCDRDLLTDGDGEKLLRVALGSGWHPWELCGTCCSSHMVTLASNFFQESMLPPVLPDQPELGVCMPPVLHSADPGNPSPSASQREHQALQDLIDLAGEGLSTSTWPCSRGLAGSGGTEGKILDWTLGPALPSGPSLS